jgi:septum formation protein
VTQQRRIVLASASPRRRELLAALGVTFDVDAADIDETTIEADPGAAAESLALRKAKHVAARHPDAVVIGGDTIVALDGTMLGKPSCVEEAQAMLESLRARTHQVASGVAVVLEGHTQSAHAMTDVTMRAYSPLEVARFIESGEPFDKAGGYAIQDGAFAPVASLDGCECNVIGVPLWTLHRLLQDVGVEVSAPALERCATCPLQER